MGGRLAGEEEMESGGLHLLAEGLVGIEVVPQEGDPPGGIVGAPVVNPAGGRPDLAVLFFPAVLPDDELRGKRHDPGLSGGHQGRSDRNVTMQDAPVRTVGHVTGGTVNRAVRREGVGPVQGEQKGSVQDPVVRQDSLGPQSVSDLPDQRGHLFGIDRIQDVPDLDVGRNMMHAEEGLDIVPANSLRQIPLEGQKRRRLGEEDGKGRAGGVEEGVLRIVPGLASIRKVSERGGNSVDKTLSLAGRDVRSGVGNPKDFHAPRMPENTSCVQYFLDVTVSHLSKIRF